MHVPAHVMPPRAQVLATLMHANHLEAEYGAGPHTLSVPRMRPADGSDVRAAAVISLLGEGLLKLSCSTHAAAGGQLAAATTVMASLCRPANVPA